MKAQLEKGTVSREQLFIATKLSDSKNAGYQKVQFLYVCMHVRMYYGYGVFKTFKKSLLEIVVYIFMHI